MGRLWFVRRVAGQCMRKLVTIAANCVEEAKSQESDAGAESHLQGCEMCCGGSLKLEGGCSSGLDVSVLADSEPSLYLTILILSSY